jgi:chromosome segregation ATPase
MQRPGAGASNLSSNSTTSDVDDDARAETVAVLDDLKERLRKTETISEQFQKQTQVLQSRLDEAEAEQGKLEEKVHESEERLETLENEKRDALRQKREMESIYEAERSSMTKEREEMSNREEEMQTIIQRLKDSLNQRTIGDEESRISRRCKLIVFPINISCILTTASEQFVPESRKRPICTPIRSQS